MLYCTRGDKCAFYHNDSDQRKISNNGCIVNSEDNRSTISSSMGSVYLSAPTENQSFISFSPYDECEPEADHINRKHARSHYTHNNQLLSNNIAVGAPMPGYDNTMYNNTMMQNPSYLMTPNFEGRSSISPTKNLSQNDHDEKRSCGNSDNSPNGQVFNNQLFEGNAIPQRIKSNSENAAYFMNRPGGRAAMISRPAMLQQNMYQNNMGFKNTISPQIDGRAINSTTRSSEAKEADHLKYCFDNFDRDGNRTKSLKTALPELGMKLKTGDNSEKHPKSQTDYSESNTDKHEKKFDLTLQRRITEEKPSDDLSQNTSDCEFEITQNFVAKPSKPKLTKSSAGFVPKHIRDQQKSKAIPVEEDKEEEAVADAAYNLVVEASLAHLE